MKTLNISFDDREFKKIKRVKELSGANSWKAFILNLIEVSAKENRYK